MRDYVSCLKLRWKKIIPNVIKETRMPPMARLAGAPVTSAKAPRGMAPRGARPKAIVIMLITLPLISVELNDCSMVLLIVLKPVEHIPSIRSIIKEKAKIVEKEKTPSKIPRTPIKPRRR